MEKTLIGVLSYLETLHPGRSQVEGGREATQNAALSKFIVRGRERGK